MNSPKAARNHAFNGSSKPGRCVRHGPVGAPYLAMLFVVWLALVSVLSCGGEQPTALPPPTPAPLRPASISVTPEETTLTALGDTVRLRAEVRDQNGQVITGATAEWSSADSSVATIDQSGLVTATANGRTTITARAASASGTASVSVRQRASVVSIAPDSLDFAEIGDTATVMAVVSDANGHPIQDAEVQWSSADSAVATVDASGLVLAVGVGETSIIGTADSVRASIRVIVRTVADDRAVLEVLYHAWGGDDWHDNTNWLTDEPLEDWFGVSERNGRVRALSLRDNNLRGEIPPEIGLLGRLLILDLVNNSLRGHVPPEIGQLQTLRDLLLSSNDLSGPLPPEIGSMSTLQYLWVRGNNLIGPLPPTFGNLRLRQFILSGTALCVPETLTAWFENIEHARGLIPCVPLTSDRDALLALFHATDGPEWRRNLWWGTDAQISAWDGVETNSEGYVTELRLVGNNLSGRIPAEIGSLASIRVLSLSDNELDGPIPAELGEMSSLEELYLSSNRLTGSIPAELGDLSDLSLLWLFENELTGAIPAELGKLSQLEELALSHNSLTGSLPPELGNLSSVVQMSLNSNQLTGTIPSSFGDLASIEALRLSTNQLEGSIPAELGRLATLETLLLQRNRFTGPIPAELGNLSNLSTLWLFSNELTGAMPPELGKLSQLEDLTLSRNHLTGRIPTELGDLSNLTNLSVSGNELTGEIPAELGKLARIENIRLGDNRLSGSIPPELGGLIRLERLSLTRNRLSGSIPPEIGALPSLEGLFLGANELSGKLPHTLGDLHSLQRLDLLFNEGLEGLIPRRLMELESLENIYTYETRLCPQIDDSFQRWWRSLSDARADTCTETEVERLALSALFWAAGGESWLRRDGWNGSGDPGSWYGVATEGGRVRSLSLANNDLSGSLAPEIVNLTELESLDLSGNGLRGPFPAGFSALKELRVLRIGGNGELHGPLPYELTTLQRLEVFGYEGTGLCASYAPTFQAWIGGIEVVTGPACDRPAEIGLAMPVVYLTQAIQRSTGDVPLIAGRDALLRVFLTSNRPTAFFEPRVVATFARGGQETHRVAMERTSDLMVTSVEEGELGHSYNAVISGEVIQPGVELVVEADPEGVVPRASGSETRFPDSGVYSLDVVEVPPMEVVVVPVVEAEAPEESIFEWTRGIGDDSPAVGLLKYAFPFGEFRAGTREKYVTSLDLTRSDGQWGLVLELEAVRAMENGTGYWYGAAGSVNGRVRGIARLGGPVSIGKPWDTELAHEVGHNLGLRHAPCGGPMGIDPEYPYADGGIGAWGYDFRDGTVMSPHGRRDIMGYCYNLGWLSDYYFEKVIAYREEVEGRGASAVVADAKPMSEVLVVWGGVVDGELRLEPAFRTTAVPRPPDGVGPYRIEGVGRDGSAEFSYAFTPGEDQFGNKYFFFTLPGERNTPERIVLTGPEGVATIDSADERTVSIVRDVRTGKVRSILRDWEGELPAALGRVDGLRIRTTQGVGRELTLDR